MTIHRDIGDTPFLLSYSLKTVNSYLIEGKDGFTIIDTGDKIESSKIWEQHLQPGMSFEKVILTHTHP